MGVPISYSIRNLLTRKLTTALTASGMALVVFVFASILMLAEGLRKTLVETGSYDNVVIIRKGSATEVQSNIERREASIIESRPEVAIAPDGRPFLSKEVMVLINLKKRVSRKPAQVVIRGIDRNSLALRPQVSLISGRMPRPSSTEIVTGLGIAQRFEGGGLGETLRFGMREWRVVGVFDAGATGFNSEIWGDADLMLQAFRRDLYSSVIFKLRVSSAFERLKEGLENDPRLIVEVKRENKYYSDQSEMMAKFLRILGTSLTMIFSIGAVIGAMITMYAAVANRTSEIGTLRSLGFRRRDILIAFVIESLLLGMIGWAAGIFFASFMRYLTISTINWQTFSELAFSFTLTAQIVLQSLFFSLIMGLAGGVLPAVRASRMKIVDALRTT